MKQLCAVCATTMALFAFAAMAQKASSEGVYRVVKTVTLGGVGTFDTVFADTAGRKLYIPRKNPGRITVFDLDTLAPVGEIPNAAANGTIVDTKSGNGFATSKPVVMFDAKTLKTIKTIDVDGGPDAILFDAFNQRVYSFSHVAPHATAISTVDGSVVGTLDLGGMPEQAVTDGQGHIYSVIRDRDNVAVIDAKTLTVTAHFPVSPKGGRCSGLAIDVKNKILFAACREPQTMVIMSAVDGKILETLPIGAGVDSAIFNPETMETYSAQVDGTLTIIKENSPTSFAVTQTVQTKQSAKQMAWDSKTKRLLLVAADYTPAVPATAGTPAVPAKMIPDSFGVVVVSK